MKDLDQGRPSNPPEKFPGDFTVGSTADNPKSGGRRLSQTNEATQSLTGTVRRLAEATNARGFSRRLPLGRNTLDDSKSRGDGHG